MASTKVLSDQELSERIDSMMLKHFKPDEPGASIIVTRKGKPIFRKGYGMANVELGVKIEPHMVFRLGSITKQFTAVSILMLMEQGKLDLQDEITKYLPGYPTQGHRITLEHLLTHTSGIKDYTNAPDFMKNSRADLELQALVDTFKPLPMDFAPGEQFSYSNSGYVMLGLIIEKVSGMKYAEFLQKHVFEPLGMANTYFDMPNPIIPGRVAGYQPAGDKFENCDYISMTLPHAAGSLASSVDDMAKWDAALYTEKLVKQSSLHKAWTPCTLNDGTSTGYGFGWGISTQHGYSMITHNGGINGFMSDAFRFPNEKVYVCILTNCARPSMKDMAFTIGAIATGKPYEEPVAIPFDPALYDNYQGVYRLRQMGMEVPVVREGDKLILMMPTGTNEELVPLSKTEFASKQSTYIYRFTLDENGRARSVRAVLISGPMMVADLTDKPLPGG
jgi:D-alanyl-D-alanine carboxypeptidase